MALDDTQVKEVENFLQKKLRHCDPEKLGNNLGQCIWDCMVVELKSGLISVDLPAMKTYVDAEVVIERTKTAAALASQLNGDTELQTQVDTLTGREPKRG